MPLDLQAIKERLAAATPGPWKYYKQHGYLAPTVPQRNVGVITNEIRNDGNALFLENVPQDIAALIEEIENLRQEKEQLLSEILKRANCFNENVVLQAEVERLRNALRESQRKNTQFSEALEFYADADWYHLKQNGKIIILRDAGEEARKALDGDNDA